LKIKKPEHPFRRIEEIFLNVISQEGKKNKKLSRIDEIEYMMGALLLYLEERYNYEHPDESID
jgi:hypothetical protein